ncbi:ferredoxin [Rhodococcus sp. SRB_17]|nr:ferredoxin [Rhodococcus sp. SRB_17]
MPNVTYTDSAGTIREIAGSPGESVMEIAIRNGVPGIVAECGGSLSCATCHVFVRADDFDKLPEFEDMEDEMLYGTAVERLGTSRLSCQIKLTESLDLHVTTPEAQV